MKIKQLPIQKVTVFLAIGTELYNSKVYFTNAEKIEALELKWNNILYAIEGCTIVLLS